MNTNEKNESTITFEEFGLKPNILRSVVEAGFKVPSPIQQKAIPVVMQGKDMIGQAHTGTGKTAAFGLPSLSRLQLNKGVDLLVITPTRELATQVSDELYSFGRSEGIRSVTVYGGQSYGMQIDRIRHGAQVVVATPGRLLDLLQSRKLRDFNPSIVVLDEADEMLDMGFLEDIQKIFSFLPEDRQTLLFSATMPAPIKQLANKILKDPMLVDVTDKNAPRVNSDIDEAFCVIEEFERDEAVMRLIDSEEAEKSIIFCRTKREVDRLGSSLMARGYLAKGLHGDMEQGQRKEVINAFQKGKIDTLIATDVAARGLDIQGVTHVFNFHIPFEADSYVHRIGRTGRAGQKGVAITLVSPREFRALQRIKQSVGSKMSNKLIPSLEDIRKMNGTKLFKALKKQDVHPSVKEFIQVLGQEIEEEKITEKLMSYILEQEVSEGPERIGVPEHRLKRFVADFERPGGNFSSGGRSFQRRRPFRGGGGGGRPGGGGGYRNFSRGGGGRSGPRRGR